ncbi:hypothetical protein [Maricaulis maris]|jgi:hypothetical protein|uniref:Secreted protein n=2 Tax=Maricaulis maris TaxID=74318 RepID=Q0AS72_MARMM|nr:hypothetical protein [Maricaulis maris]ABI64865.1 hypothetical protein Mmar10_0572 [Maricaulis maris MCS10]
MAKKGKLSRRSFLSVVTGAVAMSAVGVLTGGAAQAPVTDLDTSPHSDPDGQGRGGRRTSQTGVNDLDTAETEDRPGYGRGAAPQSDRNLHGSRCTDIDYAMDRTGHGTRCSDADISR